MNYQDTFREALNIIKSQWQLPKTGFLAGGSISNVVWNLIHSKNAPINDLDIYHLVEIKKNFSTKELKTKQHFIKNEKLVFEDYTGLNISYQPKGFYTIEKVSVDGIFNIIEYKATTDDKSIVLDSFDINCCQLGYDIEKDEFIWTKDFELFLKNGELRLSNLTSPPHSAMRLVKKRDELDAILPQFELDVIATVMKDIRFIDTQKFRFKERYAKMFKKYESDLSSRFKLVRDKEVEEYLKENLKVEDKIWTLIPKVRPLEVETSEIPGAFLSKDFLYYVRNILNKQEYEKIWFKLHPIIESKLPFEDYFNVDFDSDKIEKLSKLVTHAPNTSRNLKGLSLSKQIELFDSILKKFPQDPFVAISILENYDLNNHNIDDDMELLLMELSIRRVVIDDYKDKVYHILGIETWKKN